jgi:hypothetical protein
VDLSFKISERFDEEERRDAGQEEIVEPHRLVRIQGLQKGLIEDEYRAGRHSPMILLWWAGLFLARLAVFRGHHHQVAEILDPIAHVLALPAE